MPLIPRFRRCVFFLPLLVLSTMSTSVQAEAVAATASRASVSIASWYQPTSATLEAREWFQDARFGMFIHWGVYSVLGDGEWVMHNRKIPIADYEPLASTFLPVNFDAAEWVSLAKAAGMKYITFTSRHHDGFAMWDSKVSDWNIVKRTPYGRDVVRQLADECHRQGIRLFLYYSHLDWHHPDYYPRGVTGQHSRRPDSGDWYRYLDFIDAQLTELLTGYGEIAGIWFDGWWDRPDADWRLEKTYRLIHDLQPRALIGNNHHRRPFPGEDFQMYERDLPGHNTAGFSATAELGDLPLETCDTLNGSWGYSITDRNYKSPRDVIRYLVRSAGYNANLLLNVGPRPDGRIQPEFVERLREVGRWMEMYGESIYGTRGGPVPPRPWGVTTHRGNRVYVHVLEWPDRVLAVTGLGRKVRSATFMKDGSPVAFSEHENAVVLTLPEASPEEPDRIIVLETDPPGPGPSPARE